VAGTDRTITLFDLARKAKDKANLPDGVEPGLDGDFTRTPEAATFPNGCHIAEVEIDPDTGVTSILRYTVVDDFGGVVNPIMLMGQVHGGIAQGVGQALYERTVYEEGSGQLLTGSFMDYAMPRADVVPMFDFTTRNVRCTTNPLGIKGAGEAGAIGAPPTVINALVDALASAAGLEHIDMPATPAAVWRALQRKQAA
jgi:carbon-monoxide dehydrogenase large subunit